MIQGGLALQQDLALVSLIGCDHVERNGHHYVNGMAGAPAAERRAFLAAHPDLYRREGGTVRVAVEAGSMGAGFAVVRRLRERRPAPVFGHAPHAGAGIRTGRAPARRPAAACTARKPTLEGADGRPVETVVEPRDDAREMGRGSMPRPGSPRRA